MTCTSRGSTRSPRSTRSSATSGSESGAGAGAGAVESAASFLDRVAAELAPLEREYHLREWEANARATPENQAAATSAEAAWLLAHADPERFRTARRLLDDPDVRDPRLRRALTLYVNRAAEAQLPAAVLDELVRRAKALESVFHTFRPEWEGRRVSNNEILECLRRERDSNRRRAAWEASKAVGPRVADGLRELAVRRNEAARSLGHRDYYAMRLRLQEVDEDELLRLIADLARATAAPFRAGKREIDAVLARRYGVAASELEPWHYEDPFFQEAPQVAGPDLNRLFQGRDLVAIARAYTAALGFDLEPVLRRSDLFEREGKDPHAFCIDIDREGDVRVLANLRDDLASMDTLLHELGHAAYDVHIPRALPWWLRGPAHMSTTEAIALWMGRAPREPDWLVAWTGAGREEAAQLAAGARRAQQLQMLLTVRWMMVMIHFERAFYGEPTSDGLDTLWWDLVEELQEVRRPEGRRAPDWATKIHLTVAPVYYHNYLLGELTSAQLEAALRRELGNAQDRFARPAAIGALLKARVFAPGSTLHWQDLLRQTTGRPFSPDAFVAEFAPSQ